MAAGRRSIAVVAVLAGLGAAVYFVWSQGAHARAEAVDSALFAPLLVTPSVHVADGQVLLYKATNVSDVPRNVRLMVYDEDAALPTVSKDFAKIGAGKTVSYVHEPAKGQAALGEISIEGPRPVRAVFAPMPGDNPGAVRNIVAAVQIVRLQKDGTTTRLVEAPVVVPVEHCTYEPRGFFSKTGGRWYWNCAPQMFPINERWATGGIGGR